MKTNKMMFQFTLLTFGIAYLVGGALIILSPFGYTVYNWVHSIQQFSANIPFSIYILSPALASYIVLKINKKISGPIEWLKQVFHLKNQLFLYLYVFALLFLYFGIHFWVAENREFALPFYAVFLSLPGNLIIGGLEETGWIYLLQPPLDQKYGYLRSALMTGFIWLLWHIPLFFIAGTNHEKGLINFGMFAVQVLTFRFLYGAIYRVSAKGGIFMCVLFHTLFNALSPVFATMVMTWKGTVLANGALLLVAVATVLMNEE